VQRFTSKFCRQIAVVVIITAATTALWSAAADPRIAPPDSMVLGKSYAEWSVTWWQWVFSLPVTTPAHPLLATGAVDCSYAQQGQVWFLAGTVEEGNAVRSCTIPTGTRLFFPVFNAWADNVAEPDPFTVSELMERAASFAAAKELHVSVDGVPVNNPFVICAVHIPRARCRQSSPVVRGSRTRCGLAEYDHHTGGIRRVLGHAGTTIARTAHDQLRWYLRRRLLYNRHHLHDHSGSERSTQVIAGGPDPVVTSAVRRLLHPPLRPPRTFSLRKGGFPPEPYQPSGGAGLYGTRASRTLQHGTARLVYYR
jgi:hypothetical protein